MTFNYTQTPCEAFGLEKKSGVLAFELEVEGSGLPGMRNKYWSSHADGSLKLGGIEYVHKGPQELDAVYESLKNLEAKIVESGAEVYESERTSVHTHLNMNDKSLRQVLQVAVAYYMLEEALMNHCGESRRGNLFCLTMKQAPKVLDYMQSFVDGNTRVNGDTYRYASLNFGALKKFGSLENRTMRGYYDVDHLQGWARMLSGIVTGASSMKSPQEVFDSWYGKQPVEFMSQFLSSEDIDTIRSYPDWDQGLTANHRLLAKFVYDNDWSKKAEDFPKIEKSHWSDYQPLPNVTQRIRPIPVRHRWENTETLFEQGTPEFSSFEDQIVSNVRLYFMRYWPQADGLDVEEISRTKVREFYPRVRQQVWSDPDDPKTQLSGVYLGINQHTPSYSETLVEINIEDEHRDVLRPNQAVAEFVDDFEEEE